VTTPTKAAPDAADPWSTAWAIDEETVVIARALFDLISSD
jgi:hypothetical protein